MDDPSQPSAGVDYTPIDCAIHDRLESWAVGRTPVQVVWRDDRGEHCEVARIDDVFARDGADWVALSTGETVRADALVTVGGVQVSAPC